MDFDVSERSYFQHMCIEGKMKTSFDVTECKIISCCLDD